MLARERVAHLLRQLVAGQVGGIDQPVRPATQRRQQFAFARNPVRGRAVKRQRMPSAGFGIAPLEFAARTVEEQRADVVAELLAQMLDPFDDAVRIEVARPCPDPERKRLARAFGAFGQGRAEKAIEQQQRQVVDDLPAQVLERPQHGRLARAGHAGDEQDFLGVKRHDASLACRSANSTLIGAESSNGSIAISTMATSRISR